MSYPRQKQNESYEDACKRYAKNKTTKHLYPNLSKALKKAKKSSIEEKLEEERFYLSGVIYGCQRRTSEINYKLEQNRLIQNTG